MRIEPMKKTAGSAVNRTSANAFVASRTPNASAVRATNMSAPPFSAVGAEELQALFVAIKATEPQDYTSIAAFYDAGLGADETRRSFGKIALSPRTIRVGGRRTSVRLEPEFWLAIAYVVSTAKIDQSLFFLDIERRCGRFAFASKIRSAVVSALLKMAIVDRICSARLSARSRAEPSPAKSKAKKRRPKRAARPRTHA